MPCQVEGPRDDPRLTAFLKVTLDLREKPGGKTWRERLVEALLEQAAAGNLRAIQEVWTRLEGKPGAADTADSAPLAVADEVARKILQAGRDDDDDDDR